MVLDVSFPDSLLGLMKERLVEAEMMLAVMLAVIRMMRMSRRIRINNNIISSTSFSPKYDLVSSTAGVTSKGEFVSDKAIF